MSVYVLSDESDQSNHEQFDLAQEEAKVDCVDLTQVYLETEEKPYRSPYSDPYEDLPETHLTGSAASLSSSKGASSSSVATLASVGSSKGASASSTALASLVGLDVASTSSAGSVSSGGSGRLQWQRPGKRANTKKADAKAKKQKLAEERAARAAAAEANKVFKPGECMKYMHIEIHPSLLEQWFCADLTREALAAGAKIEASEALFDPALIMWSRTVPHALTANNGQMELSPARQRCPRALYVSTMAELATFVLEQRLAAHIAEAKALADSDVTLVIYGVKDYFKASNRKTKNGTPDVITEIELDMALTDLLVSAGCDAALVNTPNELALLIMQLTKAVAEEPHKKVKRGIDEQAEFYMRGDNRKCVPVDKDGNGVSRLWQQMIAVLPGASLESSRSICEKYKSPVALYQALQLPNGVNELADIGVSRTGVPGSKSRRLGPEFARKLRILFTSEDGDVLID